MKEDFKIFFAASHVKFHVSSHFIDVIKPEVEVRDLQQHKFLPNV
jgi:hypothetical protein